MKTLAKSKATDSLAHYVDSLGDETIVVTRNGRPIAALVSLQNADTETVKLSTDPAFLQLIERSRQPRVRSAAPIRGLSPHPALELPHRDRRESLPGTLPRRHQDRPEVRLMISGG